MVRPVDVAIGTRHGKDCTCVPLDPLTVTVQPVVVDRSCPAQREISRTGEVAGRVAITWPAPTYGALPGWGVSVHDADTGEQLSDVTAIRLLSHAGDDLLTVDLQRLVDENDTPIQDGTPVPDETGEALRTIVLHYAVAEMRVADGERQ